MFDAQHCWCCGEKEHKNGYGCNNPKCKEYYKLKESLKGANNTAPSFWHRLQEEENGERTVFFDWKK